MIKYNSFQDFITNCEDDIDRLDYWDDLQKLNPNSSYFNEPNWGNVPIERQSYIIATICTLFPKSRQRWMYDKKYILENPYFPHNIKNGKLRLLLMIESPAEFKKRNIYISENGLRRV